MATATHKQRANRHDTRRIKGVSELTFVIEDNSGDYRWSILDSSDECVAQSRTFATYDAAPQAAVGDA